MYFPDLAQMLRARARVPAFLRNPINRASQYLNSRDEEPHNQALTSGLLRYMPPQYMHRMQYNPMYTVGNVLGRGDPLYGTMSSIGSIIGNDLGRSLASNRDDLDYDTGSSGWLGSLLGGGLGYGAAYLANRNHRRHAAAQAAAQAAQGPGPGPGQPPGPAPFNPEPIRVPPPPPFDWSEYVGQ